MDRSLHCATVAVQIEVPRGGVVKRRADGSVDFVSPLPCPFNYGCVPHRIGGDGDPLDALVLGPRLAAGSVVQTRVFAVVHFLDAGQVDDKLVCGEIEPSAAERDAILAFFRWYARAKRVLHALRREPTDTRLLGWVWSRDIGTEP
jgi:inorganic pyrophosphatase